MKKDEKQYLYYIIDHYLKNQITLNIFCDEFYYCYGKELDYSTLTDKEQKLFGELSTISSRFSEFVEDHINYQGTYFTKAELNSKIIEVNEQLKAI